MLAVPGWVLGACWGYRRRGSGFTVASPAIPPAGLAAGFRCGGWVP